MLNIFDSEIIELFSFQVPPNVKKWKFVNFKIFDRDKRLHINQIASFSQIILFSRKNVINMKTSWVDNISILFTE